MAEELFDVIDERNELTGEVVPRSVAHSQGIWHRVVHIYVYKIEDKTLFLLVHLRSKEKDLNPNKWDIRFGGHIKSGSEYVETTFEELQEEIGFVPEKDRLKFVETCKYDGGTNREYSYTSVYEFTGDVSELQYNDGEVQEVKWMALDEIEKEVKKDPERWTSRIEGVERLKEMFKDQNLL